MICSYCFWSRYLVVIGVWFYSFYALVYMFVSYSLSLSNCVLKSNSSTEIC